MLWFGTLLLGAASCSLIYDLDQVQCELPEDCAGFVGETGVREVKCVEGVCAYEYVDTTSSGGTGGTGGGSGGNPTSTSSNTGGSGGGSTMSTSSTGGSAGAGGEPGCVENDQCMELGNPAICRDGECIDLYSDDCPIVLGRGNNNDNLKSPRSPLIFGAYAGLGKTIPEESSSVANFEYAIKEVNDKTGNGVSIAGVRYPFVAVVCDNGGDVASSMTHLVKTLRVPAIISTLSSRTLLEVFEHPEYGARTNNVFMLSAFDADSTLTNQDVDPKGLMWHLLGEAADYALGYGPLVARTEAYIRNQQGIPDEDMRVAMVVADVPFLQDIAGVITSTVVFNGKSIAENQTEGNFERVNVEFSSANNLSNAFDKLRALAPHIVLAIGGPEFMYPDLLGALETAWHAEQTTPPPFYLLSPYISRTDARNRAKEFEEPPFEPGNPEFIPLRERMLGLTAAGATNTTLYENYLVGFKAAYEDLVEKNITLDGTENYYDAAYFTMYAIHGGVKIANMTGLDVARGMTRLLGGDLEYDIGDRDDILPAISALRSNEDVFITLNGTMGPPDFNGSGARSGLPSIYCIDHDPSGSENEMAFFPDELRYNPDTELLEGDDPCSITGFMEDP